MGNSDMGNSAILGNSLIADATPVTRVEVTSKNGVGAENLQKKDLTFVIWLTELLISSETTDLFGGDVLINAEQPKQINKTFSTVIKILLEIRDQLRQYPANLVEQFFSMPNLHLVKYPGRLPQIQNKLEEVLGILDEFNNAAGTLARVLKKLSVAIERIAKDRIRVSFASEVKKSELQATQGIV
ncbi:hypothetical protein TWF788_007219 [Orbilia oligospora]|uniref:Uncharacterized protein n=1 Tax=Orbilia oligospora TaxID=2813651 RepID=A0A6G1MNP5_ORBOL|nr:hypothetical protein TWF788_007219 [Orbilia oligospora]KAF3219943.1 hypothetical protein TWF679_010400 [Orbilia oligospora]KAF3264313.1 hypothetical protein TWF192_004002 [Orbilia oligospora]